jgi:rfaE bifunctional protein nucleotidyltransferase chain/domain
MSMDKLKTAAELAQLRDSMDGRGSRLVFTNGCFDILHVGHVRYLQHARRLGDALAVAINGDESVRSLKGPGRPLSPEADRAEVLCALSCVDYITIFHEPRVTELLRQVRPHIYTKGGDYTTDSLDRDEFATLLEIGAEINILPLIPGKSTTQILESWRG